MNPRYSCSRKHITQQEKNKIMEALGPSPTLKQIELIAGQNEIKPVTIKSWLKHYQISIRDQDSESEQWAPSLKKKINSYDRDIQEFQQRFINDTDYNYEITARDIVEKSQREIQQIPEKKAPPKPLQPKLAQFESISSKPPDPGAEKISLQNFEALLLLLDQDDEIHSLITLLRKQELQIEELKRTQKSLLEFFCSHLTKKQNKNQ